MILSRTKCQTDWPKRLYTNDFVLSKEISGIDENSPSMKIQSKLSEGDQSPKKEDEKSTKPNPGKSTRVV